MNTPDSTLADNKTFSIAELEARFEMQAVPVSTLNPAWECSCTFKS